MRNTQEFDTVPFGEECAQVGSPDYYERSRREARVLIGQLKRLFGEPPATVSIRLKGFPHDFGTYHQVVMAWNDGDETGESWVFNAENHFPESWDETARLELAGPVPELMAA